MTQVYRPLYSVLNRQENVRTMSIAVIPWLLAVFLSLQTQSNSVVLNITRSAGQQDEFSHSALSANPSLCGHLNAFCSTPDCGACKCKKSHATFLMVRGQNDEESSTCVENAKIRGLFGCESYFLSNTDGLSSTLSVLNFSRGNNSKAIVLRPLPSPAEFSCTVDSVHYLDGNSLRRSKRNEDLSIEPISTWPHHKLSWGNRTVSMYSGRILKVSINCVDPKLNEVNTCILLKVKGSLSYVFDKVQSPLQAVRFFVAGTPVPSPSSSLTIRNTVKLASAGSQQWLLTKLTNSSSLGTSYQATELLRFSVSATSFIPNSSFVRARTSVSSHSRYLVTDTLHERTTFSSSSSLTSGIILEGSSISPSNARPMMTASMSSIPVVTRYKPTHAQFLSWWPWSRELFISSTACAAVLLVLLIFLVVITVKRLRARRRKACEKNFKVLYSGDNSPLQSPREIVISRDDDQLGMTSVDDTQSSRGPYTKMEVNRDGNAAGISNPSFLTDINEAEDTYEIMSPGKTAGSDEVIFTTWRPSEQICESTVCMDTAVLFNNTTGENSNVPLQRPGDEMHIYDLPPDGPLDERQRDKYPRFQRAPEDPAQSQEEMYCYADHESLLAKVLKVTRESANNSLAGSSTASANPQSRPRTWVSPTRSPASSPSLVPRAKSSASDETHHKVPGNEPNGGRTIASGKPVPTRAKSVPTLGREPKPFRAPSDGKQERSSAVGFVSACAEIVEENESPLYQNVNSLLQSSRFHGHNEGPGLQAEIGTDEEMYDEVPRFDTPPSHGSPGQIYENVPWG